jgi:predicted nucleotidyltransferase
MSDVRAPSVEGVDTQGIRELLDSRPVEFALLFGSRARGESEASSDVDIALRFEDSIDDTERFRERNWIDAAVQEHANAFVDVCDIETLPTPVAYAALRDGVLLAGDERAVEVYQAQVAAEYESNADRLEQQREAFIDRLASGET